MPYTPPARPANVSLPPAMSTTGSLAAPTKVDRKTTTPFLLKLFYKQGGFHRYPPFPPLLLPPTY